MAESFRDADNFEEALSGIDASCRKSQERRLFLECKLLNLYILLEQTLAEILEMLQASGALINEDDIISKMESNIARLKNLEGHSAECVLYRSTCDSKKLITPFTLIELSSFDLRDLVGFVRHSGDPSFDEELISDLAKIHDARNDVVHLPFSSRVDLKVQTSEAVRLAVLCEIKLSRIHLELLGIL